MKAKKELAKLFGSFKFDSNQSQFYKDLINPQIEVTMKQLEQRKLHISHRLYALNQASVDDEANAIKYQNQAEYQNDVGFDTYRPMRSEMQTIVEGPYGQSGPGYVSRRGYEPKTK